MKRLSTCTCVSCILWLVFVAWPPNIGSLLTAENLICLFKKQVSTPSLRLSPAAQHVIARYVMPQRSKLEFPLNNPVPVLMYDKILCAFCTVSKPPRGLTRSWKKNQFDWFFFLNHHPKQTKTNGKSNKSLSELNPAADLNWQAAESGLSAGLIF